MKDKNNISFERKVQTFFLSEKWKILNFSIHYWKSLTIVFHAWNWFFFHMRISKIDHCGLFNSRNTSLEFSWESWWFHEFYLSFFQGREGANSKVEGPFTFQAILHNNGDIIFAYKTIPGKMFSLFGFFPIFLLKNW